MQFRSHSHDDLQRIAADLVRTLMPIDEATVITLSGVLGAGKTTFVQGVARSLGVAEQVSSPTFVIEKVYDLENQPWERLVHIDAYRLESAKSLEVLRWHERLADPGNLILLEWPERVPEAMPERAIRLRFEIDGDGRIITSDGEESGGETR
jgi:tRNA threonylcarbamoyladenosine biosynthesis protein TsaE